ncbi:hypothetical protein SteCoe_6836 [Stentor coeruleus]|uniref:Tubulin--tyrosine ligase-like protein 9 n=1 Tax=Stentor coeruleus TaxID=5963 RepID=A0A1R2CP25_9CILI|nr:hypothetical protein SteCoe_6836 [Stentor coeruleus]
MNSKFICNIAHTQFDIVREVATSVLDWKVSNNDREDWDVMWTDLSVPAETLSKMKSYQRINHFPGMHLISRKNFLATSLGKLRQQFPKDYGFFPRTWVFPSHSSELKQHLQQSKHKYMIVKPEKSCQGKGIFFTNRIEELNPSQRYVVQNYIKSPYLIDGLKFDLRIYVLVSSCDPLRIYIYDEGLARFATEPYSHPDINNINNMFIHLTNYAVNKGNRAFINNKNIGSDNVGHKRSLRSLYKLLESQGHDVQGIKLKIEDIIIKTLCSIQPILKNCYLGVQKDDLTRAMCFEILGFDILLDDKLKPHLIEVNHDPSFSVSSPLDKELKKNLIAGALKLSWVTKKNRIRYMKQVEDKCKNKGKLEKGKAQSEYMKKAVKHYCELRGHEEKKYLGRYKRIYPIEGSEKYEKFIKASLIICKEWEDVRPGIITSIKKIPVTSRSPFSKNLSTSNHRSKASLSVEVLETSISQVPVQSLSKKKLNIPPYKKPKELIAEPILPSQNLHSNQHSMQKSSKILSSFISTKEHQLKMKLMPKLLRKTPQPPIKSSISKSSSQVLSFIDTSTTCAKSSIAR